MDATHTYAILGALLHPRVPSHFSHRAILAIRRRTAPFKRYHQLRIHNTSPVNQTYASIRTPSQTRVYKISNTKSQEEALPTEQKIQKEKEIQAGYLESSLCCFAPSLYLQYCNRLSVCLCQLYANDFSVLPFLPVTYQMFSFDCSHRQSTLHYS
jgi:hypothetical protein